MQKCLNCHHPFTWGKIFKSFWGWVYQPIKCNHCGAVHKITIPGRFTFVCLTILPAVILGNILMYFFQSFALFAVALAIIPVGSLIVPYCVKFKLE